MELANCETQIKIHLHSILKKKYVFIDVSYAKTIIWGKKVNKKARRKYLKFFENGSEFIFASVAVLYQTLEREYKKAKKFHRSLTGKVFSLLSQALEAGEKIQHWVI